VIAKGGSIPKLFAGKFGLENLDVVPIPENELVSERIMNFTRSRIS
jgi:hypothetical protein